jgi:hypothetical protein
LRQWKRRWKQRVRVGDKERAKTEVVEDKIRKGEYELKRRR